MTISSCALHSKELSAFSLSVDRFLSLFTSPSYKSSSATALYCISYPAFRAQATHLCCINCRAETTVATVFNDSAAKSRNLFNHYFRAIRILPNDIEQMRTENWEVVFWVLVGYHLWEVASTFWGVGSVLIIDCSNGYSCKRLWRS